MRDDLSDIRGTKPWAAGWLIDDLPRDGRRFLARYSDGTVVVLHSQFVDDGGNIMSKPQLWRELPGVHE